MLLIGPGILDLSVLGLQGIAAVGELRKLDPDGIHHIETAPRILGLPEIQGLVALSQGNGSLGQIAEQDQRLILIEAHPHLAASQPLFKGTGRIATAHQDPVFPCVRTTFLFKCLCIFVQSPVGFAVGFHAFQFLETQLQQRRPGIYAEDVTGILIGHLLVGLAFLLLLIFFPCPLLQLGIGQDGRAGVAYLGLQRFELPEVPQGILPVAADEMAEPVVQIIQIPMQRLVAAFESIRMRIQIGKQFGMGSAVPFLHPQEGDDGLVECLDLGRQGTAQRILLLPVPALHASDVLRGSVVKVHGKVLGHGFGLDLREGFGLFLGTVGRVSLVILFPQGRELVPISRVLCPNSGGAGQKGQHPGH